ncbi:MAG TPA: phosphate ABC transporter substrate-binding protein [Alphaproteobacteria bacterium]
MTAYPKSGPVTLRTNLSDAPAWRALKAGGVASDLVRFDFCGPKAAHEAFKPMVRENAYDCGELAVVTFLQARAYDKPWVMLPAVIVGRFQHNCIAYNAGRGALAPGDLAGKRVAVRSYSQTTGVWVRGVLQHDHGVDPASVTWVCTDDPHLAEYRDPANVERVPAGGKPLDRMLLDGEVDAFIAAQLPKDPNVRPLIPDPEAAAKAWYAKHRTVQINHIFAVSRALLAERPDVIREIWRLLGEAKRRAPAPADGVDMTPVGVDSVRPGLSLIAQYALEQQIIPQRADVDALLSETAAVRA